MCGGFTDFPRLASLDSPAPSLPNGRTPRSLKIRTKRRRFCRRFVQTSPCERGATPSASCIARNNPPKSCSTCADSRGRTPSRSRSMQRSSAREMSVSISAPTSAGSRCSSLGPRACYRQGRRLRAGLAHLHGDVRQHPEHHQYQSADLHHAVWAGRAREDGDRSRP